ncbi:alanyl-tRNA editing protein [Leuconostoc falkenbergense]
MKQYLKDSYKTDCTAKILKLNKDHTEVTVKDSIVFPGGGGQPADRAWLEVDGLNFPVRGSRIDDDGNQTFILDSSIPDNSSSVVIHIDWNFRFKNMRYHTLLHIISGYLYNNYGALATSSKIEDDHARLEVEFEPDRLPDSLSQVKLEKDIDEIIREGLAITGEEIDRSTLNSEQLIRTYTNLIPENVHKIHLVKIEGLDEQACGGTHVKNTHEVGNFYFDQLKNKGHLKKRMKVVLR